MEQAKGHTTGGVTDSCCSRGGGHENNVNSDCAMSDCESDCSQFEESPAMAPGTADSPTSSPNRVMLGDDDILDRAEWLTRDEVIARRARGVRKLIKEYQEQYWGLVEQVRSKYRRYYLRHGRSGWRDDAEEREGADGERRAARGRDGMREPGGNLENAHCGAQGCTAKPIPLSVFCVAHILLEPRQQLYKPCSQVIREGVTCGKPVLRAVVPSLCVPHFHQAQKQATRSLNKVLPGGVKFNPKVHLIVSQYVRTIQSKRRSYRAAGLAKKAATEVKVEANGKGVLSLKEKGPPRSNGLNGKTVSSSQEGEPPRSNGSNGKGILLSKDVGPPRLNGTNGKAVLSSQEKGASRSNGKGVLSSKEGGPPRSSSAGKGATKAAVHKEEKKPLTNGQSKGNNGNVQSKGSKGVKLGT